MTTELQTLVRRVIAKGNDEQSFFDSFLLEIETYFGRQVSSMREMKVRDNKRLKGLLWEQFCQAYLLSLNKYKNVWLWNDIPSEVLNDLKLQSRLDNGIDIICQTNTGYLAVQCKYRKKIIGTVPWNTLATFVGMTAVSGPYEKHIVMTNCKGVTRKVKMPTKDVSICYGTYKSLKREYWLKIAGDYIEHRLSDPNSEPTDLDKDIVEVIPEPEQKAGVIEDLNALRALRLKRFG